MEGNVDSEIQVCKDKSIEPKDDKDTNASPFNQYKPG